VCIRAKATDSNHTGKLCVPDDTWEQFSVDLSAKFEKRSIHGNCYQMAIIDVKSKYIWDFYLKTKDQVYPKLKEWLETETAAHLGRNPSEFEIVLFSDKGGAMSKDIEQECIKYGIRRETTAGYTPAHNAFIKRCFRTNSEMSRYNMDEAYWEDLRAMAHLYTSVYRHL
jgi:transposase InsO family protein